MIPVTACYDRNDLNKEMLEDQLIFSSSSIVMLLGAGCSIGAYDGCIMPNWEKLLIELASYIGKQYTSIKPHEYLQVAGMIEAVFREKSIQRWKYDFSVEGLHFPDHVYEALTQPAVSETMRQYIHRIFAKNRNAVRSHAIKSESTLSCVVEACLRRDKKRKRTIIVSYNYDDMLEYALLKSGLDASHIRNHYYKVYHDNLHDTFQSLLSQFQPGVDIIFVHGRIPVFTGEPAEHSGVILSQQSYDMLFRNYTAYANMVQSTLISALPVIAIGFSCDDVNFRRLMTDLKNSGRDLPKFIALNYCDCSVCPCGDQDKCDKMRDQIQMQQYYGISGISTNQSTIVSYISSIIKA